MFDYLSNTYNQVPELVTEHDLDHRFLHVKYSEAPFLMLPESLEDFRLQHKRKFWYNLERSQRLYKARFGSLHFKVLRDKESLQYFLDEVFRLFNERWCQEYTSASWKSKEGFNLYKEAMIKLAANGSGFLAVLYDEKKNLLSYGYCLEQDKTLYFYQHTTTPHEMYRTYSLGKVLIYRLLKYAIISGYKKFDFMTGPAPYKLEWTKETQVIFKKIGYKNIFNYGRYVFVCLKHFLQFNPYTRAVLKVLLYRLERIIGRV